MSGRISIDNLSDSLKEMIANSGMTEEQIIELLENEEVIDSLKTDSKSIVGAINELFQSANNGKELIANAIGEPLSSEDTFSAMSNDINGLLSTFKTNMMNNGVTVESNDRFKSLIDKIATMVEEGSNKGIQFATGTGAVTKHDTGSASCNINDLAFTPTYVFCYFDKVFVNGSTSYLSEAVVSNLGRTLTNKSDFKSSIVVKINGNSFNVSLTSNVVVVADNFTWYAIGVGEEDTTLRDSLASILEDEGVEVLEEDTMASLISKVDEEFTKDNNTINNLNTDKTNLTNQVNNLNSNIENTRNTLAGLMQEGGYDITGNESINSLLNLLVLSGINVGDIKQIACGYEHTFIVKHDGSLYSCGCDTYGGLGLNGNTNRSDFTQVTTNINNDVKQVACGDYHTVILKNDGSVWSCGYNNKGQLGLGTSDSNAHKTFTKVTTNINNDVKQISCGNSHTFILKNDGSIWSCGYNNYGGLGLGNTTTKTSFTKVTTNINNDVKQIACGYGHTVILKNDGSVWSCGLNDKGQLGLNDNTDRKTFTKVTTNINNDVKQIACGGYYTCILKNNGSIWSCGDNDYGQLGLNDTTDRTTFTQITTNINNDVKQIACGYQHTFIVKTNGSLWCCGNNEHAQLGLNSTSSYKTSFTQVTENINNDVKQVICGWYHTFILKTNISTWCCGYNIHGQIGLGDTTDRYIFTTIPRGV